MIDLGVSTIVGFEEKIQFTHFDYGMEVEFADAFWRTLCISNTVDSDHNGWDFPNAIPRNVETAMNKGADHVKNSNQGNSYGYDSAECIGDKYLTIIPY